MRYYVYILISLSDGSFYIGQTNDLESRIKRHNAGYEKYTKSKTPWKVYWSTLVESRSEAVKLERKLKNLKSRKRIVEFVEVKTGPVPTSRNEDARP